MDMSEDSCVTKGRASVGPSKSHNSILGILLSSRRKDTFALCTRSTEQTNTVFAKAVIFSTIDLGRVAFKSDVPALSSTDFWP
jgi:hypothetical protein